MSDVIRKDDGNGTGHQEKVVIRARMDPYSMHPDPNWLREQKAEGRNSYDWRVTLGNSRLDARRIFNEVEWDQNGIPVQIEKHHHDLAMILIADASHSHQVLDTLRRRIALNGLRVFPDEYIDVRKI